MLQLKEEAHRRSMENGFMVRFVGRGKKMRDGIRGMRGNWGL